MFLVSLIAGVYYWLLSYQRGIYHLHPNPLNHNAHTFNYVIYTLV